MRLVRAKRLIGRIAMRIRHQPSLLAMLATAGVGFLLVAAQPASAVGDASKEVSTAAQHAEFAAAAKDLKTTQLHLHHVVNCLVGPQGQGFDQSAGNPCDGQGSGAIPDTSDSVKKAALQQALE